MPEPLDLEPTPEQKLWLECDNSADNRAELERCATLQDKEQGYPREGVTAAGRPPPAGVPGVTERWAAVETTEDKKRIRLRTVPGINTEEKLPHLSTAEQQELKDAYVAWGSDLVEAEPL